MRCKGPARAIDQVAMHSDVRRPGSANFRQPCLLVRVREYATNKCRELRLFPGSVVSRLSETPTKCQAFSSEGEFYIHCPKARGRQRHAHARWSELTVDLSFCGRIKIFKRSKL